MSETQFLQENWPYFLVLYIGVFGWILYKAMLANRGKIKVRIKTPTKEWIKWCKPQDDGETIIVEKENERKKRAKWSFKFTNKSLVPFRSWGRQMFAIDVFYHSLNAIEYDFSKDEATAPKITMSDVKAFATLEALKRRYGKVEKEKSLLLVVVAVLVVAGIVLQLVLSGRIHIG